MTDNHNNYCLLNSEDYTKHETNKNAFEEFEIKHKYMHKNIRKREQHVLTDLEHLSSLILKIQPQNKIRIFADIFYTTT